MKYFTVKRAIEELQIDKPEIELMSELEEFEQTPSDEGQERFTEDEAIYLGNIVGVTR